MSKEEANCDRVDVPHVTVSEALALLSDELRLVSDGVSELQELIGSLVGAGAFSGSQSVYQLQALDHLTQSVEAAADFMSAIARQAKPEWKIDAVDAARNIKLAEMSERLSGITMADKSSANSGDFDEFEEWSLTG